MNRGMKSHGQGYLRAKTEISADKSGDILPQCRAIDHRIKRISALIPPTGKNS